MYGRKREKASKRKGKFIAIRHVEEKFYELRQDCGGGERSAYCYASFCVSISGRYKRINTHDDGSAMAERLNEK